ncbi:MAG: hypothetical protein IPK99_05625 [Flavobacteriales bacterium]|nr:hypothetical protein [Flavobacteriales bacterium]
MKALHHLRAFATVCVAASSLGASCQSCTDLNITSVTYSAFYDSLIEVRLLNSGPISWNYPSLIVYDANNDTLAFHEADLFALTTDQTIVLPLADGATIPTGPINGTIELWTGFNTTLECTFAVTIDLCPAAPCVPLRPFLFTNNATVAPANIAWHLEDSVGTTVANGVFHLDSTHTYVNDSACLAPGSFSMVIDPAWTDAEHLYFGVGTSAWNAPTLQAHLLDTSTISFTLLEACMEGTNAIPEEATPSIRMILVDGMLTISTAQDEPLGRVDLYDMRGTQVLSGTVMSNVAHIDLHGKAAGIYSVLVGNGGAQLCAKVFVASTGR